MPQPNVLKLNDLIRVLVNRPDFPKKEFRMVFENGTTRKMTVLSVYTDFIIAYENSSERTEIIPFGAITSLMVIENGAKLNIVDEVAEIANSLAEGDPNAH